jgi:hypothetical protein
MAWPDDDAKIGQKRAKKPKVGSTATNWDDSGMGAGKGRGPSLRDVEKELGKLRRRGLSNPRVQDLKALLAIAQVLSNKPREAEQIEDALLLAIDGFALPEHNILRVWFGLAAVDDPDAPDTRGMTSKERHKAAWEYAGSPGAESTFRSTRTTERYKDLAARLVRLYEKALAQAAEPPRSDGGLADQGQIPAEQPVDAPTPEPDPDADQTLDDDGETAPKARPEAASIEPPSLAELPPHQRRWPRLSWRVLAAVAVVLVAGGTALVVTSGGSSSPPTYHDVWGPTTRPIYNYRLYTGNNNCADGANPSAYNGRCGASTNFPVFNSFIHTPYYGDERMFFDGFREQQSNGKASDPIKNVTDGNRIVVLRIYVDNDAQVYPNEPKRTTAYNTRVRVELPPTVGKSLVAYAHINAERAIAVYDSVDLTSDQPFSLEYIPGSAVLYDKQGENFHHPYPLSDEIIGSEGALVGVTKMDGVLPPETYFSGALVELKVRVVPQGSI